MADVSDITGWRRFDTRLTTSGQPTTEQLALLPPIGVRHVVNLGLHSHDKALPDEAAALAALAIAYVHIPVAFDHPTETDFSRFCAVMAELAGEAVHVHCIANLRVSAFLYRWQRDVTGGNAAAAKALMDSIWQPGGAWAAFIGDGPGSALPHRPPARSA